MSEREDRPAVDVERVARLWKRHRTRLQLIVARHGHEAQQEVVVAVPALLAENAALREEVEREREQHAECDKRKEEYHEEWMINARELVEAIERADRLQQVVDGVRELADDMASKDPAQNIPGVTTYADALYALLPDDEDGAS